jgi:hypothetical protein
MKTQRIVTLCCAILVISVFLVGCSKSADDAASVSSGPVTTEVVVSTTQSTTTTEQLDLFQFVQTVQVTPDPDYLTGSHCRIFYVSGLDRFEIAFAATLAHRSGGISGAGFAHKQYSLELEETGITEVFSDATVDVGSVLAGDIYCFVALAEQKGSVGWQILEFDAAGRQGLVERMFYPLDYPQEAGTDPMVAYVDGQLDISSRYSFSAGSPDEASETGNYGTHHHFFSLDLESLGDVSLTDPPHGNSSALFSGYGIYYLIACDLSTGALLVAEYEENWRYVGGKTLVEQADPAAGLAHDGERFYVAYADAGRASDGGSAAMGSNIHVAAFDRDWNLLDDVDVTDFAAGDGKQAARPWVISHEGEIYVSYEVDTVDVTTGEAA